MVQIVAQFHIIGYTAGCYIAICLQHKHFKKKYCIKKHFKKKSGLRNKIFHQNF